MTDRQQLDALLAPIPGSSPGGEDLSYCPEFDAIRAARRSDDPLLAQGEWETEIKTANWARVQSLCEELLVTRSKDFQVACWYAEAAARIDGFAGLDRGLQVVLSLLTDYWEFAYPALDPTDLDERAGKVEWLNSQLPLVVRSIALTTAASGGYNCLQWDESRSVANLGLRDPEAMAREIADGKLAADAFDRAVSGSGAAFYAELSDELADLEATMERLITACDRVFGDDAPSLKDLNGAVHGCRELAQRFLRANGGRQDDAPVPTAQEALPDSRGLSEQLPAPAVSLLSSSLPTGSVSPRLAREEAVRQLRAVARYFREYEPHSPVAPLVERAAKWAEMPFEQWLANVIKDESTLSQLHDLLDVRS